jgi:N-acetylneuraminic acid mutarotase
MRALIFALVLAGCSSGDGTHLPDAGKTEPRDATQVADTGGLGLDSGAEDASQVANDAGQPALGVWEDRARLPEIRQENAVVALGGEVFTIGGFIGADITRTVRAYDPATDRWRTDVADLPAELHHANAAAANGRLYVAGFLEGPTFSASGRTFAYDPASNRWSEGARMPAGTERGASGMAVWDGIVYVAGGQDGPAPKTAVSAYDPARDVWTALPDLPTAANHLAAAAIAGTLYAIGGRGGGIRAHTAEVWALELANTAAGWTPRAPMPTSRAGAMGAVLGRRVFVFGGEGNPAPRSDGVFAETEVYDPARDTWTSLALMRIPRHGTGAAALGDRIYVPGGATRQGFGAVDDHQSFAP